MWGIIADSQLTTLQSAGKRWDRQPQIVSSATPGSIERKMKQLKKVDYLIQAQRVYESLLDVAQTASEIGSLSSS